MRLISSSRAASGLAEPVGDGAGVASCDLLLAVGVGVGSLEDVAVGVGVGSLEDVAVGVGVGRCDLPLGDALGVGSCVPPGDGTGDPMPDGVGDGVGPDADASASTTSA